MNEATSSLSEDSMATGRSSRRVLAWGLILGLGLVHALAVAGRLNGLEIRAFCHPAARLAALQLGGGIEVGETGYPQIMHPALPLQVTEACSGFDFFLLTLGLGVYGWARTRGFRWRQLAGWALAAYGITVLANAVRLSATVYAVALGTRVFPAEFRHVLHLAAGVTVFLPLLILVHHLLERKPAHALAK